MKSFELTLQVRNNQLKARRLELSLTQRKLAEKAGIGLMSYNALEAMRRSPLGKKSPWRMVAYRLADFHGISPEELFPPEICAVTTPKSIRELNAPDAEMLLAACRPSEPESPEKLLETRELKNSINNALQILTPREKRIMELRFGLNGRRELTLEEAGKVFYVSRDRIRQIEARALRKLRHPNVIRQSGLKEFPER